MHEVVGWIYRKRRQPPSFQDRNTLSFIPELRLFTTRPVLRGNYTRSFSLLPKQRSLSHQCTTVTRMKREQNQYCLEHAHRLNSVTALPRWKFNKIKLVKIIKIACQRYEKLSSSLNLASYKCRDADWQQELGRIKSHVPHVAGHVTMFTCDRLSVR